MAEPITAPSPAPIGARTAMPTRVLTPDPEGLEGFRDLWAGLKAHHVWWTFALHDIRMRFKRSVLGPLWITLSMGVMVGAMGLVFSTLFGQDIGQTLPHIAVGLICWGLLTSAITDGTTAFIGAESYIRNVPMPLSTHLYRVLARDLIIFGLNMAIYLVLLVWFRLPIGWTLLQLIPAFALFLVNCAWMALVAGILSTRYRDIPQVINSVIQVVFFVTPVFWSPETLPNRPAFIDLNPLYHLLELLRAPLLGNSISLENWLFSLGLGLVGTVLALLLYRRAYARIAYWV